MLKLNNLLAISLTSFLLCSVITVHGQYAHKKLIQSDEQKAYVDSLKSSEYTSVFPIWGEKAVEAGFDIPYPAGVMLNYFWTRQGLLIDNLELGFTSADGGTDVPLTEVGFIQFGDNTAGAWNINVRPDLWVLPFLDVYGIFGYGQSITTVNLIAPVEMTSVVTQNITTKGFGFTGAFGVGAAFVALDANVSWTKPDLVNDPVQVSVISARYGHTYNFRKKPYRNVGFWVGAMRVRMDSRTEGAISMREALSDEVWDNRDELLKGLNTAIAVLPDGDKKETLEGIRDAVEGRDGSAVVKYGLDKLLGFGT